MFTSVSNYVKLNSFTRADSEGLFCNMAAFGYRALFILVESVAVVEMCRIPPVGCFIVKVSFRM